MPAVRITQEQKDLYREEGYMILENAMSPEQLELLRGQCQAAIDRVDRRMDEEGSDVIGINHRCKR